jgi:hypothetical protein
LVTAAGPSSVVTTPATKGGNMHRYFLIAAAVAAAGVLATPSLAQTALGLSELSAASHARIRGQLPRYRVVDVCSRTGNQNPCVTVIQINNLSAEPCDVGVEFFSRANRLVCRVTRLDLPAGQQASSCSRPTGDPESCNDTCNPALTANAGFAVVHSSCVAIGIQATIITKEADDLHVSSARRVNLIALRQPPATNANQGD